MNIWRWLDWPAWLRRLAVSLYFLVHNWLLLAPASAFEEIEEFLPHQDKIVHGALFLTLAFLARWSLPAPGRAGGAASAVSRRCCCTPARSRPCSR